MINEHGSPSVLVANGDARIATGVPGFDTVLGGGLIAANLYLFEGATGAGKTILASQIAFNRVARGDCVLYLTLLAESHGKLFRFLQPFPFFQPEAVGTRFVLLSGLAQLLDQGLDGLQAFIAEQLRAHRPALLVIDGFGSAIDMSGGRRPLARFIHRLSTLVSATRCTTLLLAPHSPTTQSPTATHPEHALVDGLIELQLPGRDLRRVHQIEVLKQRGGPHMGGGHLFSIDGSGIRVFPRLEAAVAEALPRMPMPAAVPMPTGLPELDRIVGGGYPSGSATCVLGPAGIGKTLLGMTFLDASLRAGRGAMYVGFGEPPERVLAKATRVGLDLQGAADDGALAVLWRAPLELAIDSVAHDVLAVIDERRVGCLVVDGLERLYQSAVYPERLARFLTAFMIALGEREVTSVLTLELPLFDAAIDSGAELMAVFENLLLMRFLENDGALRRLIAVLKLRDGDFDAGIHALQVSDRGLVIGERLAGADRALQQPAGLLRSRDGVGAGE